MTKADEEKAREMLESYDMAKHQAGPFNALINASELVATALSQARAEAYADAARVCRDKAVQAQCDQPDADWALEDASQDIEAKAKEAWNGCA